MQEIGDAEIRRVTGADGKPYQPGQRRPAEARRRPRRPLPDAYRDAVEDLRKAAARLQRLHTDDRFTSHRPALARHHRRQLLEVVGDLRDLLDDLGPEAGR